MYTTINKTNAMSFSKPTDIDNAVLKAAGNTRRIFGAVRVAVVQCLQISSNMWNKSSRQIFILAEDIKKKNLILAL